MSNGSNTTQPTLVERLRELLPATPQISTQVDVAPPEGQPRRLESGQALVTRPLEKETPVVQRLVEAGTILDHIVFDPFGTLVGIVRSTADDIRTVSHIVPDELDHPAIQAKLAEMGFVPENLRPLAELNARFLLVQERTAARDRLAAFGTSMLVGGIAGSILRNVGVTSQVVLGAGEAGAFGATFGVLDPEIDVITSTLVAVPLGTVGGLVGAQLSKVLKARGVKPHLEVPEIEPNARNLSRVGETRKGAPFIEKEPGLGGKMTEGAVKASERKAQPGLLEKGAAETAARDVQTLAETEARRIVRGGSVSASEASILSKVSVGAKEARPKVFGEFYTKYLDDLHPINLAVKDLLLGLGEPKAKLPPGVRLGGIEDPYVLARLSRGSVGKANAFLETGPLDFATLQPVGPGLKQIVEPVVAAGKLESLRAYLPARRALELEQRGIETPFTDILDAAKKTVADVDPVVARATAQLDNYQSALLKYMQDSGILSGEQVKLMQEANRAYVPFYKFIEGRIEGPPPPSGPRVSGRRFANLRPGLRRIRGGKVLPVVDPLESIVRNTYAFVRLADRQAVSDALVRLAERYKNLMGEEPTHIIARTKPGVRPIELAPAEMKKSHKNLMELLEVSGVAEKLGREELSAFSNGAMTIFRPRERLPEGVI
jgi:hypothetical protein